MNYRSQTVSAVMITFNNAPVIERALESLRWADELIVIDGGSTDGTLDTVRRFTKKVFFHPSESLSERMQYGFSLVSCDWTFFLQPSEWVEEMLRHEIDGALLNVPEAVLGFTVPVKTYILGQWVPQGGNYPRRRLRLFRKGSASVRPDAYGSVIAVPGELGELERPIGEEPYRSLGDVAARMDERSTRGAYRLIEKGGNLNARASLLNIMFRPLWLFVYRYLFRLGFVGGFGGLLMALTQSMETFLKYSKLRAMLAKQA